MKKRIVHTLIDNLNTSRGRGSLEIHKWIPKSQQFGGEEFFLAFRRGKDILPLPPYLGITSFGVEVMVESFKSHLSYNLKSVLLLIEGVTFEGEWLKRS